MQAKKPSKRSQPLKPRNPVLVPALGRKAGKHAPDPKGVRRKANRDALEQAARRGEGEA